MTSQPVNSVTAVLFVSHLIFPCLFVLVLEYQLYEHGDLFCLAQHYLHCLEQCLVPKRYSVDGGMNEYVYEYEYIYFLSEILLLLRVMLNFLILSPALLVLHLRVG